MLSNISALNFRKSYNYANYLTWQFKERLELIKGKLHKMSPAPARKHQEVSGNIFTCFSNYFFKKECKVFSAPFDVRFPNGDTDEQVFTVVQPDICVICDKKKLDDRGCLGAPDLIIEILSPATATKDAKDKFYLYEENGVKEYWLVSPDTHLIDIFLLDSNGKYQFKGKYTEKDIISPFLFKEIKINLSDVFEV